LSHRHFRISTLRENWPQKSSMDISTPGLRGGGRSIGGLGCASEGWAAVCGQKSSKSSGGKLICSV